MGDLNGSRRHRISLELQPSDIGIQADAKLKYLLHDQETVALVSLCSCVKQKLALSCQCEKAAGMSSIILQLQYCKTGGDCE